VDEKEKEKEKEKERTRARTIEGGATPPVAL
jgi:hypothetical protein